MEYKKPPLSFEDQADRLLKRGMVGDHDLMIQRLQSVNYYRLSGYWFPFRQADDSFNPGLNFDTVWDRYVFDRRLRVLIMDAIERIEVAVRTHLAYNHSFNYGAFGYADDPTSLPQMDASKRTSFLEKIKDEQNRSQETFVDHFKSKYGDHHDFLPIWMATEVMSFGCVLSLYRGVSPNIQKKAAKFFGIPDVVLDSWLLTLNTVRNICAHHGRLWNRELGIKPKLPYPRKNPKWYFPKKIQNNRTFVILTICQYCLSIIAPQSRWANRLDDLLSKYPAIPLKSMGFPDGWKKIEIWKNLEGLGYGK